MGHESVRGVTKRDPLWPEPRTPPFCVHFLPLSFSPLCPCALVAAVLGRAQRGISATRAGRPEGVPATRAGRPLRGAKRAGWLTAGKALAALAD